MNTQHKRLFLLALATALITFGATSCGTFRGIGQDVGHVGHHIEHAASR